MTVIEHYQAGRLKEALAAAAQEVKSKPNDIAARRFLSEMLCFSGDFDRADLQLDAMAQIDSTAMLDIALTRHLIRAEQARRDFHVSGRVPEVLTEPSPEHQLRLRASIMLREKQNAEAVNLLNEAEALRHQAKGTCDGTAFDDFRDVDDLTASVFEVLTTNGKYYWIPIERVELMEFHPPTRTRDLLWRRVHMVVSDGPDGEVYLPVLYPGSHLDADDKIKLGRATDWHDNGGSGPYRGVGQRTFLVGDEDKTIMELTKIEFASAVQGSKG